MDFVVIIPARYRSSRLMGKPLIKLKGVAMIVRTYRQCIKAVNTKFVYVATDDKRIKEICEANDIKVIMTSKNCLTGTDRVYEVAKKLKAKTYINVQGDEPLFNPIDLLKLIKEASKYPKDVITGYCEILDKKQFYDLNVPKVILSKNNYILYASRAPIPSNKKNQFIKAWRQVCAYAFPKEKLKTFYKVKKKTPVEKIEDIEYLRFLEMGIKLRGIKMSKKSIAVDTKEDVTLVNRRLK
jgi:3-deoxy-manno-octulosonate cytidylyltransferase (CMP-KDO synthetase)